MRKKIVFLLILCAFLSTACSKKNAKKTDVKDSKAKIEQSSTANTTDVPDETKDSMVTTTAFDKEKIDNLIKDSDYISKVRISTTSDEGVSPNFLKDYKGDLSIVDIKLPKSLAPNKEYIVFYKDYDNGDIEPTDKAESFVEIQDENDGNLNYVEKIFGTYSGNSKVQNKKGEVK